MKSLEPATLLARASQPSCTNGAIFRAYNIIIQFNARMRKSVFFRDSACLSKKLKNGSNRPRASEEADRDKHAYPDGELQIAEYPLEGGASLGSQ